VSAFDEIVQGRKRFLERRLGIEAVHNVQIDVVRAQSAKTRFAGSQHVPPRKPRVGQCSARAHANLGRNDDISSFGAEKLAETVGMLPLPKVITPKARRDTMSPLLPSRVYCMKRRS
jgi:hypothetical protein